MRSAERHAVSRREFLRGTVATGVGLASWHAAGGQHTATAATTTLNFKGWNYEPDLVQENIDIFKQQHSDIQVKYEAIGGNYMDKIAALFIANSDLDCLYVRDTNFAGWVDAGWLRPIEGLPGVEEYKKLFYNHNRAAMTYEGKLYGLPYYTDFHVWAYNEEMLHKAGFEKPGRTLDEITEQARKIKEKGILAYPIVPGYTQVAWGHWEWWAYVYASQVNLFDDDANPILQDDPRAEKLLQWLVDGIHKHKIIDSKTIEMNTNMARDAMGAGQVAFTGVPKYDLQRLNDPKLSQVVGKIKMMPYPTLEPNLNGTVGWTRMYSLTKNVRNVEAAWKLIQYLGGKDSNGEFYTAKRWYLLKGLGFAYPHLWKDKEISESTSKWASVEVIEDIGRYDRSIEIIKQPWYTEYERFHIQELQRAFLQQITPKQALVNMAKFAKKIKAQY